MRKSVLRPQGILMAFDPADLVLYMWKTWPQPLDMWNQIWIMWIPFFICFIPKKIWQMLPCPRTINPCLNMKGVHRGDLQPWNEHQQKFKTGRISSQFRPLWVSGVVVTVNRAGQLPQFILALRKNDSKSSSTIAQSSIRRNFEQQLCVDSMLHYGHYLRKLMVAIWGTPGKEPLLSRR